MHPDSLRVFLLAGMPSVWYHEGSNFREVCMQFLYHDKDLAVVLKPVGMDSESAVPALIQSVLGGECYTVHRLDLTYGSAKAVCHGEIFFQVRDRKDHIIFHSPSPFGGN